MTVPSNLPAESQPWRRDTEKRLAELEAAQKLTTKTVSFAARQASTASERAKEAVTSVEAVTTETAREPQQVTGLIVTPEAFWDSDGGGRGGLSATWDEVWADQAGQPVSVARYEIWGRKLYVEPEPPDSDPLDPEASIVVPDEPPFLRLTTAETVQAIVAPLEMNTTYTLIVRAIGANGVPGPYSDEVNATTPSDLPPMVAPDEPAPISRLGTIIVPWSGTLGGQPVPPQFSGVFTEISDAVDGVYVTEGQNLLLGNSSVISKIGDQKLVRGNHYWVRSVGIDRLGQRTTPSTPAEVVVLGVEGADIEANSITANEVDVGSLRAEIITATAIDGMTITGAQIQTVAAANRGIKLISSALLGYDSAGQQTFKVDATTGALTATKATISGATVTGTINATGGTISGALTVTGSLSGGIIRSSVSGARVEMNGDSILIYPEGSSTSVRLHSQYNGGSGRVSYNVSIGDALLFFAERTGAGSSTITFDGDVSVPDLDVLGTVRLHNTSDLSLTSTGHAFQIGEDSGANLAMDNNQIETRNNGGGGALFINTEGGGNVTLGTASSVISTPGQLSAGDLVHSDVDMSADRNFVLGGYILNPYARSHPVTSNYVGAWINEDGRIGASASSRRFKQDIADWTPDKQAVLAMRLVQFRYNEQVELHGDDAPIDYGLIAEELVDLGLTPWVFFNKEGQPQGVHYERLALALLPVIQDHEGRLAALEAKLA